MVQKMAQLLVNKRHILLGGVAGLFLNIALALTIQNDSNITFHLAVPGIVGFFVSAFSVATQSQPTKRPNAIRDGILAVLINAVLLVAFFAVGNLSSLREAFTAITLGLIVSYIFPGVIFSILGALLKPNLATLFNGAVGYVVLAALFLIAGKQLILSDFAHPVIFIISGLTGMFAAISSLKQANRKRRALLEGMTAGAIAGIFAVGTLNVSIQKVFCEAMPSSNEPCRLASVYIYFFYVYYTIPQLIFGAVGAIIGMLLVRKQTAIGDIPKTSSK